MGIREDIFIAIVIAILGAIAGAIVAFIALQNHRIHEKYDCRTSQHCICWVLKTPEKDPFAPCVEPEIK